MSQLVSTVTMTNTWAWNNSVAWINLESWTPASATWTVSTLVALYLIYPFILTVLQTYSSDMLQILIIIMFQIQLIPYFLIKHICPFPMNTILYVHPLFRIPVFTMGVSAGLLSLRGVEYPLYKEGYVHLVFPWKISVQCEDDHDITEYLKYSKTEPTSEPSLETASSSKSSLKKATTSKSCLSWKQIIDFGSVIICLAILYEALRTSLELNLPAIQESSQIIFSHLQLLVIIGLSKEDHEQSWMATICNTKVSQFLGQFSMAIFMVHEPVISFLLYNTPLNQGHISTITVATFITLLTAVIITYLVEKPFYNFISRKIKSLQ